MTLTTAEAALVLGISPAGVRQLVHRGRLRPVLMSKPRRFRWADVEAVRVARMPPADHARLDDLARRWEASA
jgi:excisionase family DNA binding protein